MTNIKDLLAPLELILWDVDMTLVNNQAQHVYARDKFITELVLSGHINSSEADAVHADLHKPISSVYEIHLRNTSLDANQTVALFADCFDSYPRVSPVYEGGVETILYLGKQGKINSAISAAHTSLLKSNVKKLQKVYQSLGGQGNVFDALVGEEIGRTNKPHFEPYNVVMSMLGSKSADLYGKPTVYFGDSQSDADFSKALNDCGVPCHFIWIAGKNPKKDFSRDATMSFENMAEVYAQLK